MPELPEVETVKQGLSEHCSNRVIESVIVRQPKLRWPIPKNLAGLLQGKRLISIDRRGKYLLLKLNAGVLLMHLGMSGVIQLVTQQTPVQKHDHVDIIFDTKLILRFRDPRRFGAILYTEAPIDEHPLLLKLGPEPLDNNFNGEYIFTHTRNKKSIIKSWLMNAHHVVGVGNIYANEVLFACGIHPSEIVGRLSEKQCQAIAKNVKQILKKAIKTGGTTLKDFKQTDGKPGYFKQQLSVYDRENQPCYLCQHILQAIKITNRQTVFCPSCQKPSP